MAKKTVSTKRQRVKQARADAPIPVATTMRAVARMGGAPREAHCEDGGDLARETIADALLALANPKRKAEHGVAAECVAEGVTLAGIAAARQVADADAEQSIAQPIPLRSTRATTYVRIAAVDVEEAIAHLESALDEVVSLSDALPGHARGGAHSALEALRAIRLVKLTLRGALEFDTFERAAVAS